MHNVVNEIDPQSSAYLMQQGWARVINLRGGIIAWARHGYAITPPGR